MPPRFIARQLSCPSGFFGGLIGKLMNRHNAAMNAFAFRLPELAPSDRVLEIGFGGGVTLPQLIARAGFVGGIDRSRDVIERAKTRFAGAVTAGRAEFRQGRVEALPSEAGSFGKICTVNTVYFWSSLEVGLAEIRRVLAHGGRVVVGFLPKERMHRVGFPADIFTARAPDEVAAALAQAGFAGIRIARPRPTTAWNVFIATG